MSSYISFSHINYVSPHDQQEVSDTALFPCKAVSSIMSLPWPIVGEWPWLLYFFGRQSYQSCLIWPTVCEWTSMLYLFARQSHINHMSYHDQQAVSDTALCHYQTVSSIMSHPMTHREWVTLLYFFAQQSHINHISSHDQQGVSDTVIPFPQSHQSCLIPWWTGCEWHCFISLPGSLINHVSSHDQQYASDTSLFLCQAVWSIMLTGRSEERV